MQLQEPGRLCKGLGLTEACPGRLWVPDARCPSPNSRKWETCQVFYKIGHSQTVVSLKGCVSTLATQLCITKFRPVAEFLRSLESSSCILQDGVCLHTSKSFLWGEVIGIQHTSFVKLKIIDIFKIMYTRNCTHMLARVPCHECDSHRRTCGG